MTTRPQEPESILWTWLKYGILLYFNILILPFTLTLALSRLAACASNILFPEYYDVPALDKELEDELAASLATPTTPRSSGEWDISEWEERLPLYRKKRAEWSPDLFWEDDDGYNLYSRRASSMSSIREE